MVLRDVCIQRPVLALVLNLLLLVGGLYALATLPVRYLPSFDIPVVLINTTLPGGSAESIERSVTAPIEEAVALVDGIDYMASASASNLSAIQLFFKGGVDPDDAAAAVRARVGEVLHKLPTTVLSPVVQTVSVDSQPSIYLSFRDPSRSALELTEIIDRRVKPLLSLVPGVSSLPVMGERRYAVRVRIDRFRLADHGLTVADVLAALQSQSVELPGGEIVDDDRRVSVIARTALHHPSEFDDLVVADGPNPIRLADVAEVAVEAKSVDTVVRIDGTPAIAVGVQRRSDANPVEISRAVRALIPTLGTVLPPGIEVAVAYDNAVFIDASMKEVSTTILITIALVVGVVMLFLGALRSSLVVIVAIPLSLGGGLAFLALMGYSLNIFTLLAFVLVIGLVVDDAIVEVENIQRHVDAGMPPLTAAFKGSREIGFAVLAMTLTLAAVYAPIGLMPGMVGSLFREFGLTLAATVIVSGFVAMTLSPVMCSRLLRPQSHNPLTRAIDGVFAGLAAGYRRALLFTLARRWLVIAVAVAVMAGGVSMLGKLPGELAPPEDQGYTLVMFSGPQDASPDYMNRRAAAIEAVLETVPERVSTMSIIGMPSRTEGIVFMLLKPWEERTRTAMRIQAEVEERLAAIPGAHVAMVDPNPLGGGGQAPVQFVLKSTLDYPQLDRAIRNFVAELKGHPSLRAVTTDLDLRTPVDDIDMDRDRAAQLGVRMDIVASALGAVLDEQEVVRFDWQGTLYPVLLGLASQGRIESSVLEEVYIRTRSGTLVPASTIATVTPRVGAASFGRFDQLRAVTVSADLAAGASLAEVAQAVEAIAARTLPPTVQTDWKGTVRQLRDTGASTGLVFVLAIVVIGMVLAAQFESFRDPLIVLSVAPLSIAGAGFALALSGGSLNLYSGVGFITLIGLIAKHGILITEFANQMRDEGKPLRDAVVDAATIRLRPILMTTAAMVLGALPLALADGPGATSRADIGWVIVGGMLLGTFLSLFLIPAVYTLLSRKVRRPLPPIPTDAEIASPVRPAGP